MASITSLSNSNYNTSSIYGSRNVLSGLASGMDTESMIENAVSGIKLKIQNLVKKRTKVEWQQEAYRSIIDKAVNLNTKYTSYSSKTNLLSSSFFNNAVNTITAGAYKDKITASGKSSSDIKINAVKQMAKSATYTVSGLGGSRFGGEIPGIEAGEVFDISGKTTVSTVSGSLTFQYGGANGTTFDISFDELENLDEIEVLDANGNVKKNASNAEKLAQAINNKLGEISYNYTKNGVKETTTADKAVKVTANADGRIVFSDGLGNGNKVTISSAAGDIKDKFGLTEKENDVIAVGTSALTKQIGTKDYLSDKELGITFNGTTKKISMADVFDRMSSSTVDDSTTSNLKFRLALQDELDDTFGEGKITVSKTQDGKLAFQTGKGDTMSLGGSAVKALGFENGDSNFINASKKLSDLLGEDNALFTKNRMRGEFLTYDAKPIEKTNGSGETYYVDHKGNRVDKDGYRVTNEGKAIYDFQVNDAHIQVTQDTTLESLMNSINSNPDAGMKVSYSKLTNEFKFTTTETGANSKIEFGGLAKDLFAAPDRRADYNFSEPCGLGIGAGSNERFAFRFEADKNFTASFAINGDDSIQDVIDKMNSSTSFKNEGMTASFDELAGKLVITDNKTGKALDYRLLSGDGDLSDFNTMEYDVPDYGVSYTAGQDAVMDVEINGKRFENLTRASNSFEIDGLTINVKGEFETKEGEEAVTFETSTDSDKIVDAIKSFVEDYNEMVTEIKNAYSTQPATKSDKSRYEPLTAEEEEQYSESERKAYEEKAKQGILFGDSTLSSMYSKLLSAIAPGGADGQTLREIGLTTSYNGGLTTLSLDEDKLRSTLESDPDKVKNAFTKTREGGASSDGLMQTMQNTLNTYVKTTGEPKGVLITRAGSVKAPTSLNSNSLKSQIDSIDNQIDRWQDKMASQIDRYTTQFSRLEQLIAQMNSQASAMAGLMGGSGGY
ncbi:MAG: flagellar filament capping protein FliD [Oscillospiraceae bacterium]